MVKGYKSVKVVTAKETVITPSVPEALPEDEKKYRYVCDGCTNDALRTTNTMVGISVTCPICNKTQTTKSENYIAL